MKNYVCAILLLMYGVTHFATQVQGDCQYGSRVFSVGAHTIHNPCAQLICHEEGEINIYRCPFLADQCKPNQYLSGYFENSHLNYPACCPKPLCLPDYH